MCETLFSAGFEIFEAVFCVNIVQSSMMVPIFVFLMLLQNICNLRAYIIP